MPTPEVSAVFEKEGMEQQPQQHQHEVVATNPMCMSPVVAVDMDMVSLAHQITELRCTIDAEMEIMKCGLATVADVMHALQPVLQAETVSRVEALEAEASLRVDAEARLTTLVEQLRAEVAAHNDELKSALAAKEKGLRAEVAAIVQCYQKANMEQNAETHIGANNISVFANAAPVLGVDARSGQIQCTASQEESAIRGQKHAENVAAQCLDSKYANCIDIALVEKGAASVVPTAHGLHEFNIEEIAERCEQMDVSGQAELEIALNGIHHAIGVKLDRALCNLNAGHTLENKWLDRPPDTHRCEKKCSTQNVNIEASAECISVTADEKLKKGRQNSEEKSGVEPETSAPKSTWNATAARSEPIQGGGHSQVSSARCADLFRPVAVHSDSQCCRKGEEGRTVACEPIACQYQQGDTVKRIIVAWHCLVGDGKARRAVRSICKQFRTRALTKRVFISLSNNLHMYRIQNSRLAEDTKKWICECRANKLLTSMATWRRRTVRSIIHQRGVAALRRLMHTSNSRLLLHAWWAGTVGNYRNW